MLMTLLGIVAVPVVLLFACFLFFAIVENLGPMFLAMLLIFKFMFSWIVALIRYPFRSKETASPA